MNDNREKIDDKVMGNFLEGWRKLHDDPKKAAEVNRILHNMPVEVTNHEEFVAGVAEGTIGFKVLKGEPIEIVSGSRKIMFNICAAFYLVVPLLTLPFWAYHEGNWWLLLGIPVASLIAPSYVAFRVGHSRAPGAIVLLLCIISWLFFGIHNYFTFFSLCFSWGCMFFLVAEEAQNMYAMQTLTESRELFEKAIAEKRIFVVRKQKKSRPGAPGCI
jgi:hypothetical protein